MFVARSLLSARELSTRAQPFEEHLYPVDKQSPCQILVGAGGGGGVGGEGAKGEVQQSKTRAPASFFSIRICFSFVKEKSTVFVQLSSVVSNLAYLELPVFSNLTLGFASLCCYFETPISRGNAANDKIIFLVEKNLGG